MYLRNIKYLLIIILSIVVGLIWWAGILVLLNINLNIINIWILPVIVSIGINNAILILNHWRQGESLHTVYYSTGFAILITMITIFIITIPFCFSTHIGLSSISLVFVIGLWCSVLAQVIIFPSMFEINIDR